MRSAIASSSGPLDCRKSMPEEQWPGVAVSFFAGHLQCSGVSDILFVRDRTSIVAKSHNFFRMADTFMQWEYKLVALGLLVDATEPHQREKHEEILNGFGREGWEAIACAAQERYRPVEKTCECIPGMKKNPATCLIRRQRQPNARRIFYGQ